jgi:sec-independent protein translocase protein TatA
MFGRFGVWEIALILVIILIVFGVGKLPQVGSALGKGMRAFKKGQSGEVEAEEEEKEVVAATPRKTTRKKAVKS